MAVRIEGKEYPIGKVFSDDFVFKIPAYQRPYSWTEEHAGELLGDLLSHLEDNEERTTHGNLPYFLGSVVLIKGDEANAEIVDGQQRLTTLAILLSVIRHLSLDNNPKFARDLTDFLFEKGNAVLGTPDRPRLTLRELDQPFFYNHIQSVDGLKKLSDLSEDAGLSDARENIRNNAMLFIDKLAHMPFERQQHLAQLIITRCVLILITTPDLDYAYRVFSILNDRGLELSHTDIMKAEIIGGVPAAQRDDYMRKWEGVEEKLGRKEFDRLFTHIRTIYMRRPSKNLLSEYRHIVENATSIEFIDKRLTVFGEAYIDILNADGRAKGMPERVNEPLYWLHQINHVDWLPVAILYYAKHKGNEDKLSRFFKDLERLAAYLAVMSRQRAERIKRYNQVLSALTAGEDIFDRASGLQLMGREKANMRRRLETEFYGKVTAPAVRYVLLRLDARLSESTEFYDYPEKPTVEHILPRKLNGGSQWSQAFDSEAHKKHVNRLGNLLLISGDKNTKASNYDFDRKKSEYLQPKGGIFSFALTKSVLNAKSWTPAVIDKRQKQFVETLAKLWRLN